MAVKIRLRRTGRKKQPSYRIVVAESTAPREGAYLDAVGTYNPLTKPAELRIDLSKVDDWIARGAEMTPTVRSLVRKAKKGGDAVVAVRSPEEPAGRTAARQEGERARRTPPVAAAVSAPTEAEPAAPAEAAEAAEAAEPTEA